jgi:pyruvate dehydrogenase E1 component
VYDPFVCRGLDALIYALYNGARFVVVGTPAGVTLSPEGGAHQSTITPSIGMELPGLAYAEPAYAIALDWLLCDGLARVADDTAGESLYLRLSTRPLDQRPFAAAAERIGTAELRRQVLAGGYRLVDRSAVMPGAPVVNLVACGAVLPEVLAAGEGLEAEGIAANVIDLTSPDRAYRGWRAALQGAARSGSARMAPFHLESLIPAGERHAPIVTIHDAASHALAWVGSVFGAPAVPVGVDAFGQSGSIADLYEVFDLLPAQITNAALLALTR